MIRILTQKQAIKEFPDRHYEEYDKMVLVVGTRKEFKNISIKTVTTLLLSKNKKISIPAKLDTDINRDDLRWLVNSSLDVDRPGDTRLVIWK